MLALEPWGWTLDEIRRVPLESARRLYIEQAVRRSEAAERKGTPQGDAAVVPSREEWIATMTASFGDAKPWGDDWDRLKAGLDI